MSPTLAGTCAWLILAAPSLLGPQVDVFSKVSSGTIRATPSLSGSRELSGSKEAPLPQESPDPREVVDRVDRLLRGQSSHGLATMDVKTERWERSLLMEIWSLGTDYVLVRVLEPRREAGTATLKAGEEIWNYFPRADRTIRIPPSMMAGSWMGSHLTNDDLIKETRLVEAYEVEVSHEGPRDGTDVWEYVLTPRPEAAVVWGRLELQVRRSDLMPTWLRYYDDRGRLARTTRFSDYRVVGGKKVPTRLIVEPAGRAREETVVRYERLEFGLDLDASFFSLGRLRASR